MGASAVPGKKMAVFGLRAVLNHLRAAGQLPVRRLGLGQQHRVHAASTRGTMRDIELQWFNMALEGLVVIACCTC